MAVLFYGEGEHGAGFIGFRVVTTVGHNSDYRQQYFSLSNHDYIEAYRLAHELDKRWRVESEQVSLSRKISHLKAGSGKHIISQGLTANIVVENKTRAGRKTTYFYPVFSVKIPGGGKGNCNFRISKYGYKDAYHQAVSMYCDIHSLGGTQYHELMARLPSKTLFTEHLLSKTQSRGHAVTKEDIEIKLGITKPVE